MAISRGLGTPASGSSSRRKVRPSCFAALHTRAHQLPAPNQEVLILPRTQQKTPREAVFFYWRSREDYSAALRSLRSSVRTDRRASARLSLVVKPLFSEVQILRACTTKKHRARRCFFIGDLERIRTSDPQLRRLLLYPAELRDLMLLCNKKHIFSLKSSDCCEKNAYCAT